MSGEGTAASGGSASRIVEVLAREAAGGRVLVRGWLRTARHGKGVSFLEVTDGSCLAGLQVVAEPGLPNYESELRGLGTGCAVEAEGELVASPAAGQRFELRAGRVALIGPVGDDYPLQKKRHSFE
ncbi:MAG TPA: OB-fold nucleic acid binding domain-containing protein, partial [Myxococcota bacterium]|nr:OB-fold nucleic acid binding domain-containing protein [Myxococcota bacterium]